MGATRTTPQAKDVTVRSVEPVPGLDELLEALASLRTRDEYRRFLRDLCTLSELEALSHRWEIARLLDEGKLPYLDIAQRVGASTTAVTRVSDWLNRGTGGYRVALERARGKATKGA